MAAGRKRKKKRNRFGFITICLVLLVLIGTLSFKTGQLRKRQEEYQDRIEALEEKIEEQESITEQLEEQRIYVQTKQYVEDVARQKLGLVNEDEILIKAGD